MTEPNPTMGGDGLVEGDFMLLEMARALHAGVRDEPFARMDFSDAQWARLEAAAAVIRAETADRIEALEGERDDLAKKVYRPGVLRCAKCSFRLVSCTLWMGNGAITPRETTEHCPNDGAPMWRVSWEDECRESDRCWEQQVERAVAAETALTTSEALVTSLRNQLDSVSQSQPGYDGESAASATLSLLDRRAAEAHCRTLWGERQDDCAKYGADISMPTVEVAVDELADLLRGAEEALKTIEGLGRLGELVTAFVDPSGVLNVAGLKARILALEAEK